MTSKNITVNVNTELYREIKQIALDDDKSIKEVINNYLAEGVQKHKGQQKLD